VQERLKAGGPGAVSNWAQSVLAVSQTLVPVDTGALKASGHVEDNPDAEGGSLRRALREVRA
jgi:hypothetical protein